MKNDNMNNINEQDIYIENRLKNSGVDIPESLRPDAIEKKLASLSSEEMEKRKDSIDVPEIKLENTIVSIEKKRKKNVRKIIIPIAVAASLVLVFGLGVKIGRGSKKTDDAVMTSGVYEENEDVIIEEISGEMNEPDEAVGSAEAYGSEETIESEEAVGSAESDNNEKKSLFKNSKTDNYDMAYDILNDYKEYLEDLTKKREQAMEDYEDDGIRYMMPSTSAAKTQSGASDTIGIAADQAEYYTDTNIRTEGVSEADIVKTDGKYIYEYDSSKEHINIYSAKKGKIEKVSSINLLKMAVINIEMYIAEDKLVVIGKDDRDSWVEEDDGNDVYTNRLFNRYSGKTAIVLYDIRDRSNPEFVKEFIQDGDYDSSRLVGDYLYTFSRKYVEIEKISKKDRETYLPEIDGLIIDNDDLIVQPDGCNQSYVVISAINVKKNNITDRMGLLAGSSSLYVSSDNIFLTDKRFNWRTFGFLDDSKIIKVAYNKGKLEYICEGSFPGYLNDDYSIDEYDDCLRLVTTYRDGGSTYNGLYIYDKGLKKLSVIKKLAEGETIKSARFMGRTAYFVTFRNTDPLFAVDLSNPENPEITDYLKIPGFSAYLHPYSDGLLLGIGYDTNEFGGTECIKLSMFDVSDPENVKEKDRLVLDTYEYSAVFGNRKTLMFDDWDGLFGFVGMMGSDYVQEIRTENDDFYSNNYLVFDYDEKNGFKNKLEYNLGGDSWSGGTYEQMDDIRGLIIGDYLYVVETGKAITSFDTKSFEKVEEYR